MKNNIKIIAAENDLTDSTTSMLNRILTESKNEPETIFRDVIDIVERAMITRLLVHTRGNQSQASWPLGINRGSFRTKLIRHELLTIN